METRSFTVVMEDGVVEPDNLLFKPRLKGSACDASILAANETEACWPGLE
jgi:hypothetical protein